MSAFSTINSELLRRAHAVSRWADLSSAEIGVMRKMAAEGASAAAVKEALNLSIGEAAVRYQARKLGISFRKNRAHAGELTGFPDWEGAGMQTFRPKRIGEG